MTAPPLSAPRPSRPCPPPFPRPPSTFRSGDALPPSPSRCPRNRRAGAAVAPSQRPKWARWVGVAVAAYFHLRARRGKIRVSTPEVAACAPSSRRRATTRTAHEEVEGALKGSESTRTCRGRRGDADRARARARGRQEAARCQARAGGRRDGRLRRSSCARPATARRSRARKPSAVLTATPMPVPGLPGARLRAAHGDPGHPRQPPAARGPPARRARPARGRRWRSVHGGAVARSREPRSGRGSARRRKIQEKAEAKRRRDRVAAAGPGTWKAALGD